MGEELDAENVGRGTGGYLSGTLNIAMKKKFDFRRYVFLAVFAALAFASLFVIKIGGIGGFLSFDTKDAIITVASLIYGPIAGVAVSLVVSFLELVTVSSTGIWGFIMNFISSSLFAAVASLVYHYVPKLRKTFAGSIVGMAASVVLTTGAMLAMNLLITPIYTGMSVQKVAGMILPLLLPFNLVKYIVNAALVLMLYKPLAIALRKTGAVPASEDAPTYRFGVKEIVVTVAGVAVIAAGVAIFIIVFNGDLRVFS